MTDAQSAVRQRLTIICPVFNEAETVPLFFARLRPVVENLSSAYDVRLVFANNASRDETLGQVLAIRDEHPYVHIISLSANVGYQRSLQGALQLIDSDLYVIIDVDCEDPPELIQSFVEAYEGGYDIVYGERVDREEPRLLKQARHVFYRLMRALADDDILLDMAEFSLMSREVRDAVVADETSFPFIRASIGRAGYRRQAIPYKRERRIAGVTHYNLFGMATFAVAGILSASTWLLRITIYVLPVWIVALTLLAVAAVTVDGSWPLPVMLLVAFVYLGCAASFIAIYVARIYKNTLGRPNFFVDSRTTYLDEGVAAVPAARARVPALPAHR